MNMVHTFKYSYVLKTCIIAVYVSASIYEDSFGQRIVHFMESTPSLSALVPFSCWFKLFYTTIVLFSKQNVLNE